MHWVAFASIRASLRSSKRRISITHSGSVQSSPFVRLTLPCRALSSHATSHADKQMDGWMDGGSFGRKSYYANVYYKSVVETPLMLKIPSAVVVGILWKFSWHGGVYYSPTLGKRAIKSNWYANYSSKIFKLVHC